MFRCTLFTGMCILLAGFLYSQSSVRRFSFTEPKMGTAFTLILWHSDSTIASRLARESFLLADSLNRIFSDYLPDSELSRINRQAGEGPVAVSPAFIDVLKQAARAYRLSGGAFNCAVGPLSGLWRRARKRNEIPPRDSILYFRALSDMEEVAIDTIQMTITLRRKGMALDVGGIAKGYTADVVLHFLTVNGVKSALVDAGGDIAMSAGQGRSWKIALPGLQGEDDGYISIEHCAVATSGPAYQNIRSGTTTYSHILDPGTGLGITAERNITVIAKDGITADWLATACSVLSWHQSKKLASRVGADVMMAEKRRGKERRRSTRNFPMQR